MPDRIWYRDLTEAELKLVLARLREEAAIKGGITTPYVWDDGRVTAAHGIGFRLRDVIGRD